MAKNMNKLINKRYLNKFFILVHAIKWNPPNEAKHARF